MLGVKLYSVSPDEENISVQQRADPWPSATSSVLSLVRHNRTPYGKEHYDLKKKKAFILGERASWIDSSINRLAVRGNQ